MGRLVARMGDRQEAREIAGAAQRIDLPALGEQDGMERRQEPDTGDQRQHLCEVQPGGAEAVEQRLARGAEPEAPGATEGLSHTIEAAETKRVSRPTMMPRGMSRLGFTIPRRRAAIARSRERARRRRASQRTHRQPERQHRAAALRQLDRRAIGPGTDVEGVALNSATGSAESQNTARQASAAKVMTTVTRKTARRHGY